MGTSLGQPCAVQPTTPPTLPGLPSDAPGFGYKQQEPLQGVWAPRQVLGAQQWLQGSGVGEARAGLPGGRGNRGREGRGQVCLQEPGVTDADDCHSILLGLSLGSARAGHSGGGSSLWNPNPVFFPCMTCHSGNAELLWVPSTVLVGEPQEPAAVATGGAEPVRGFLGSREHSSDPNSRLLASRTRTGQSYLLFKNRHLFIYSFKLKSQREERHKAPSHQGVCNGHKRLSHAGPQQEAEAPSGSPVYGAEGHMLKPPSAAPPGP